MRRLRYQRSALRDTRDILRYVEQQSGDLALAIRFIGLLKGRCRHLASLPGTLGRPRSDLGEGIRSFAVRSYVIIFRYEPGEMRVIRIIEGHRDIDPSTVASPHGPAPQ